MTVEYLDEEPNGLATMVGELIESNLEREPGRHRLLAPPADVGLLARDADVGVTLGLAPSGVRLANGVNGSRLDLLVVADSSQLLELASAPLRFGLPDVLTARGRRVAGWVVTGSVGIRGMLRHPRLLARVTRLLSVG